MKQYIGLIRSEDGFAYGVEFPDFPGCVSAADNFEDIAAEAYDALSGHIGLMVEAGDKIPSPTPLADILADPEYKGLTPIVVSVPVYATEKSERFNITMKPSLWNEVKSVSKDRGMNNSSFIAEAVRRLMKDSA